MKKHTILSVLVIGLVLLIGTGCKKQEISQLEEVLYLRNNGADMPAWVYGNGASGTFILLLHGGPGGNGLEYRSGSYYEALEENYAMVYWDQRGQGASKGSYSQEDVTIAQLVEDTHRMILLLKAHYGENISVFLMGHSWGGTLGSAYMVHEDYQHELKGWIEASGAHDLPQLNREALNMFKRYGQREIAEGRNTAAWQRKLDFVQEVDRDNITIEDAGQINQFGHEAESLIEDLTFPESSDFSLFRYLFTDPGNPITSGISGGNTSNLLLTEVESANYTPELHKITIPTLLLWGKYDFVVPPALGQTAYEKISSADKQLIMFDQSGHSPMNNEPDKFSNAIIDFVERNK